MGEQTREALEAVRTDLGEMLRESERQRRQVRDEILRLAWDLGMDHDDPVLLRVADLSIRDLVMVVREWVQAQRERRERAEQAAKGQPLVQRITYTAESLAGGGKSGGAA